MSKKKLIKEKNKIASKKSLKKTVKKPKANKSLPKKPIKKTLLKKVKKVAKALVKKAVSKPSKIQKKPKQKIIEKKQKIDNKKLKNKKEIILKNNPKKEKNVKPEKLASDKKSTTAKVALEIEKASKKGIVNEVAKKTFNFKVGDYVVYPSHGIGKIIEIENTIILGNNFSCYLMRFEKEKMQIRIPLTNVEKIGLRPLTSKTHMEEVFSTLRSGVKKLKGMWSRRAQEYESKINSGDIMLLAEVLRDLTRDIDDSERSYSERIIYETAISRLAAEYAVIHNIDFEEAKNKVIITARDKLNSENGNESKNKKDDFDDFDVKDETEELSDEDEYEDEDEDEDDEDLDEDYEDEDDETPKKKRKK